MKILKNIFTVLLVISITITCKAEVKKVKSKVKKPTIKVALLLDTSSSMDGLIDQAKAKLWSIINELSYAKCEHETPHLEIALYEYGNDKLEVSDNFIRQVIPFSADLDKISERLFSLTTNGGSEYCGTVIKSSIDELNWGKNDNDLNLIFIAGNEPFTQGKVDFNDAITDAIEKNVTVNTIFCGNYENGVRGSWKRGAIVGKGEYMNIDHNKKIIHIVTPYDDQIIILNRKLNKTYVYYGSEGEISYENQTTQDKNAMEMSEQVIVSRAVSKSKKIYNNAKWDLVDAVTEDEKAIEKVDKKQLPKELQEKSKDEIKKMIAKKTAKRKEIQKEIEELNKKRIQYLANNKSNNKDDELESVMIKAIKKQAKSKNYHW